MGISVLKLKNIKLRNKRRNIWKFAKLIILSIMIVTAQRECQQSHQLQQQVVDEEDPPPPQPFPCLHQTSTIYYPSRSSPSPLSSITTLSEDEIASKNKGELVQILLQVREEVHGLTQEKQGLTQEIHALTQALAVYGSGLGLEQDSDLRVCPLLFHSYINSYHMLYITISYRLLITTQYHHT